MSDHKKAELLKAWDELSAKGQDRLIEELYVFVELDRPDHQERVQIKEEIYRVQMAKVRDLKTCLEKLSVEVRKAISARVPTHEFTDLLVTQELLSFLVFAAEYKPYYYFEQDGATFSLAKKMIRTVPRQLANLESSEV